MKMSDYGVSNDLTQGIRVIVIAPKGVDAETLGRVTASLGTIWPVKAYREGDPALLNELASNGGATSVDSINEDILNLITPRERQILTSLDQGLSYRDTAARLGISLATVQSHIRNLYRKLSVHSQVQAINKARELGLIR
jgi:DNA-binding NarL/FixJ family response regulator